MIHYNHNTGKHTNIKLQPSKRRALPHYRHQNRNTPAMLALALAPLVAVAAVYLIITA
jgi:hypothetical protein